MKKIKRFNMDIGNFKTNGNIFLAPMAGVTDLPFRLICKELGCNLLYTEMINAKAVCYKDENTFKMLTTEKEEGDVIVQIFGSEPKYMGEAAAYISDLDKFKAIDINMGCPVPKVVKNGEGSALMKTPSLASEIVREVKTNSKIPITVKFRTGWDAANINAVEFAKVIEDSGADAIAVHGRTREQFYSGKANWDIIAEVKQSVKIPVIANGDVFSVADAVKLLNHTKSDGIMVGRGAQGNPFIFREFEDYSSTGKFIQTDVETKIKTIFRHYDMSLRYKGLDKTIREMRKHVGWYLKGIYGSAKARDDINKLLNIDDVYDYLNKYLYQLKLNEDC